MQDIKNTEIIELLISLSEKYDCHNIRDLITELEVGEEFMRNN